MGISSPEGKRKIRVLFLYLLLFKSLLTQDSDSATGAYVGWHVLKSFTSIFSLAFLPQIPCTLLPMLLTFSDVSFLWVERSPLRLPENTQTRKTRALIPENFGSLSSCFHD